MKLFKSFAIGLLVVVGMISAVPNPELTGGVVQASKGEVISADEEWNKRNLPKNFPGGHFPVKTWVSMANEKTQELFKWIVNQENVRRKITQEGMRKLQEKRAQHIKAIADEIKMYLDNAVKQANLEK